MPETHQWPAAQSSIPLPSASSPRPTVSAVARAPHIPPLGLVVFPPGRSVPRAPFPLAARLASLGLALLVGGARRLPAFPLAVDRRQDVRQAEEARHDRVADHGALRGHHVAGPLGESQSQTTVYDSEDDGDPAEPDVPVGPDGAGIVALEEDVVQEPQHRLEGEQREEHDADDRVRVVEGVEVLGHPDADAEGDGVEQQAEDLEQAVHDPEAWEGGEADHDAAYGEEEAEG
jgi:hypothetical protein